MTTNSFAIRQALCDAAQWRLMVLWLAALWLPTLLVALPFWHVLSQLLDHSVLSTTWASQIDTAAMGDVGAALLEHRRPLGDIGVAGALLTLLMSPWLAGTVVTAMNEGPGAGIGRLVHGGLTLYGRMLRLWLWSLIPLGLAVGIGSVAMDAARDAASAAILRSDARMARLGAAIVMGLLIALVHASIETGRAQFALADSSTSAWTAWWRGLRVLRRRFFTLMGVHLLIAGLGLAIAAGWGLLHLRIPAAGVAGFIVAQLITQLSVLALIWIRTAWLASTIAITRRLENVAIED